MRLFYRSFYTPEVCTCSLVNNTNDLTNYIIHQLYKTEITQKINNQGQKNKSDLAVLLLDVLQVLLLLLFAHIGLVDSQVVTSAQLG